MANSFELRDNVRQQHLKERTERSAPATTEVSSALAGGVELTARKRRKQTYTVYLDKDLMGRVQRLAKQKNVAASAVIEACVKIALKQLEE